MSLFGQNNNQQQSSGFGGFGSTNNNAGGFGQSPNTGTGFGSGTAGTSGFGGFGSGTSGFGSNNNNNSSPFGQQNKPAFGAATTSGGLFGSGTATSGGSGGGFGGFGSSNTNTNNTSGGGLFGSTPKPAFGGSPSTGGLFSNSTTNAGFGSTTNTTAGSSFGSPFGGNNAVCEGTGSTPFSAFTEKEGTTSVTNHFQSISFMAPYKNWTFEELRLADYNQGRRYGNGSGQAGAFGSTNFGGFGQQQNTSGGFGQQSNTAGGGLFGSNTQSSTPFGNTSNTGFGSTNTANTPFGQKPGGPFGATTSSGTSGGLFGTANNTTTNTNTGFGSGTTGGAFGNTNPTGGGLFGQGNNQQQSKPFSFGSTTATAGGAFGSGGGFGSTPNTNTTTGGGMFGSGNQTTGGLFGQQNNNNQPQNPFGGFGQQNQPANQSTSSTAFPGFGQQNQEQKTGGLFGSAQTNTTAGGGLFGSQSNTQPSGGLFGQPSNNQSTGGSLFDQKPATGGSLFGQNNNNTSNPSGGLFGGGFGNQNQNQNQQSQGGGLFGNTTNQQKPGGLFGNTNANNGGGGLFGTSSNTSNQQPGASLFNLGGQNQGQQQQPAGGSLFGSSNNNNAGTSLFGNSLQQQQQPPQQNHFQPAQTLQTSIMDPNAFGSPSIFSGLPPPPQVSGPIATPISQKTKQKKNALLPYYKLAPSHSSAYQTPTRRGYGFSYSTYASPGSVSSIGSTPGGLGSSSLFSSVGRGLGKSLSTSNLRGNYASAESILTPGAFSTGGSRYGGAGSMKRLTIDRSLRTDLFGDKGTPAALPSPEKDRQPSILKKKVSFDASTVGGNGGLQNTAQLEGTLNGESTSATPSAEEQGLLRSPRQQQKVKVNGGPSQSEMQQIRGNELAIVPEDGPAEAPSTQQKPVTLPRSQEDQIMGAYWMSPSKDSLQKMSKEARRHISNFSVGRHGCGKVEFNEPVDLSIYDLNDIYDTLVLIRTRSLTVYPDVTKKAPLGNGLNVPSTLYLENSWPRKHDRRTPVHEKNGARVQKHIERLRKVGDTEFVDYQRDTGTWIFRVPHFTTYGFDYDDDASEGESLRLSDSVLTVPPDTPTPVTRASGPKVTSRTPNAAQSSPTSLNGSSREAHERESKFESRQNPMLPGSFDNSSLPDEAEYDQEMAEISNERQSVFDADTAASSSESSDDELVDMEDVNEASDDQVLVVRDADRDLEIGMAGAYPVQDEDLTKHGVDLPMLKFSGDWTNDLLHTLHAQKGGRQRLRHEQTNTSDGENVDMSSLPDAKRRKVTMLTSIDLMNSLFGQSDREKGKVTGKVSGGASVKSTSNAHALPPPIDGPPESDHSWYEIVSEVRSGHPVRFTQHVHLTPESMNLQRNKTDISVKDDVPTAKLQKTPFHDFLVTVPSGSDNERFVWELASILFDEQRNEAYGIPSTQMAKYDAKIRKDRLIAFWQKLCQEDANRTASESTSTEERAVAYLSARNKAEACEALAHGKDFRLASLVAQIGGNPDIHEAVASQISAWRDLNVLSEMSEPIRAIYSLAAGSTCMCEGKRAQHIEDKASSFPISERFNLDWKRSFGLKLYYGILNDDPIEAAVAAFTHDLDGGETTKPGEDVMFSLLRLYTASMLAQPVPSLDSILLPHEATQSAISARLSFQLYFALTAHFPSSTDSAITDRATKLFAVQLDATGEWLWAMFALIHITEPTERKREIQALLSHHAKDITADPPFDTNTTWKTLTQELQIPEPWIWQAKALYARTTDHDRLREANYLVKGAQWAEAHQVLSCVVGPECVIGEEWAQLQGLLEAFKHGKDKIEGWGLGGQVYGDYLDLMMEYVEGKEKVKVLGRLLETLRALERDLEQRQAEEEEDRETFLQRVAVQEMSMVAGREVIVLKEKGVEATKKLQIPKEKDAYLKETMAMSERYQKALKL